MTVASAKQLCVIFWAYAVAKSYSPVLVQWMTTALREIVSRGIELSEKEYTQLMQVECALQYEEPSLFVPFDRLLGAAFVAFKRSSFETPPHFPLDQQARYQVN